MSTENIKVESLGEDGEMWIVTGTADAHSAEEAVRAHDLAECGDTLEDRCHPLPVDLSFKFRTDWKYIPDPYYDEILVWENDDERYATFAGFQVTL